MSTSANFREAVAVALHHCRIGTLKLFDGIDREQFCRQVHPDFSPVGWHLGHIAYTEELWLLQHCAGFSSAFSQYHSLFTANGLPKQERVHLPTLSEVQGYLDTVRKQVLDYLEVAPIEQQKRLWHFILQHESQHCETIAFVLFMQQQLTQSPISHPPSSIPTLSSPMIEISAGEFEQGNDGIEALDNERSAHRLALETYWIDPYPVTCGEYQKFMEADGYQNPQWWSTAGWKWLQENPIDRPLYWSDHPAFKYHPVCGLSWYEADAYCRFVGKRLPTESEWEKAASWEPVLGKKRRYPWGEQEPTALLCNHDNQVGKTTPVNAYPAGVSAYGCWDMLGNVWEWTASWFEPYEGFKSYPYPGYSQAYFDGEHRVLRGGSWTTRPWSLRSSFRNWYHPGVRQILAGFRCALG